MSKKSFMDKAMTPKQVELKPNPKQVVCKPDVTQESILKFVAKLRG